MRNDLDHGFLRAPRSSCNFAAIWWWVKWAGSILLALFLVSTAVRAILTAYDHERFPEALLVKVELLPLIFPVHMVTGGLALLLVPLTFLLRGTRYHKWAGRFTVADVLVAGITAIPVALTAPVAPLAAAGFATQGVVWLALISKGVWHIRRREIQKHRNTMLMMAAVTSGAMFFRIYLALWAIYGSPAWFEAFYACDSWIAWVFPLALSALIISMRERRRVLG